MTTQKMQAMVRAFERLSNGERVFYMFVPDGGLYLESPDVHGGEGVLVRLFLTKDEAVRYYQFCEEKFESTDGLGDKIEIGTEPIVVHDVGLDDLWPHFGPYYDKYQELLGLPMRVDLCQMPQHGGPESLMTVWANDRILN